MRAIYKNIFNIFGNKRGFYEGSKITQTNKDFWNATSPFETTASSERDVMRARARWLSANNAIMDNIDNAIINNVIGTGISLQSETKDVSFNNTIEDLFSDWANDPDSCDVLGKLTFFDMQRLILKTRMVDGEVFIYKKITRKGLSLQIIEADALDNSTVRDAIELDGVGKAVRYNFVDVEGKRFSIKAEHIINYHLSDRATQVRGLSEYKQAIVDLKNFQAFQTASIQGARARANIAYAIKQNDYNDPAEHNTDMNSRTQTLNGVSVMYLERGEEISKLDPDSVATDYVQFSENTIRLIATARKISYELAFRDYSKVNFASSRASLLQDFKRFDFEQEHLKTYILNDIFKTFVSVCILKGQVTSFGGKNPLKKMVKSNWIMPKRDLVDPLKEITAIEKKIKLNLTCETDVARSSGEDYEQLLIKKSKEMELKKKYGIPDYTLIVDSESGSSNDTGKVDLDTNITGGEKPKKDKKDA